MRSFRLLVRESLLYREEKGKLMISWRATVIRMPGPQGSAERAFVKLLDGGCSSPVASHAEILGDEIYLRGLYYNEKDGSYVTGTLRGNKADAESLGRELAETHSEKRRKQMKTGKVWLVGAGPGDIGLFTLKGLKVLEQADVVVYDSLVGQGVLSRIPENARLINVGKRASHHIMRQENINQVLLEEAQRGFRVVRLKGGGSIPLWKRRRGAGASSGEWDPL